jgi:hypothetical protein
VVPGEQQELNLNLKVVGTTVLVGVAVLVGVVVGFIVTVGVIVGVIVGVVVGVGDGQHPAVLAHWPNAVILGMLVQLGYSTSQVVD